MTWYLLICLCASLLAFLILVYPALVISGRISAEERRMDHD